MTLLSIGVRPNNKIAKDEGFSLNKRGGIVADDLCQTDDKDIYAVGDVIGVKDFINGNETMIPLAGPANKQGRAVAANMLGKKEEKYRSTIGTSVARIFDLTVSAVGSNEKILKREGYVYKKDYYVVILHPMSHAGYFPGALPMTIKLIFTSDGEILGGQIVGYDGVDKRIDTLVAIIYFKGSVYDLSKLELAYAPPYSSAKDTMNFVGYLATNVLENLTDPVLVSEYLENKEKYQLLDMREKEEPIAGSIPSSINIPLTKLRNRLGELSKKKHYLVYCAVGLRGYISERILKQKGFKVSNLIGGYRIYMDLTEDSFADYINTSQDKFEGGKETVENSQAYNIIELLNVCGLSCHGSIVGVSKKYKR
ncbi:rhodanese-like domain-containing protein [uncultured Peptoniphilus sp.]|uniref:rhodanese-like domain-containing protein n=1 Tax=uncultured Peptoniphilus sp. TaxID=254354 RepID=UPI00280423FB|nr:rhodanese-like domain-containing protein [uncultured Peptoniphilus sp.]